jgi:hypothetical protein
LGYVLGVVVVSRGRTWAVLRLRRPIAKADCGAYAVLLGFFFLFWVYLFCDLRETGTLRVCRYLVVMCRVVLVLAGVHAATCM